MSVSRKFLVIIALASLTCLLFQLILDGWTHSATLPPPEDASEKHIPDQGKVQQSPSKVTQVPSTKSVMTSNSHIKMTKSDSKATSPYVQVKAQLREVTLSPNAALVRERHLKRQKMFQQIWKRNNITRARTQILSMRALKSMPEVDPNKVTRVLVLTYFRAGSTFCGDLLQQNWRTFFHFEPLHFMSVESRISDNRTLEAYDLMNDIFNCNFTDQKKYMQWVKRSKNQFLFSRNLFLWVSCHGNARFCFDPEFVSGACKRAPVHLMKLTRLHMHQLRDYLQENPDQNLKVVYLSRDPRGILSSRWVLDWCNTAHTCADPGVLCNEISEDLQVFKTLREKQPSNFIHIRYEDLSLNPENEAKRLFEFLQLPFSVNVKKYLTTHTKGRKSDDKNPYSTRRNSSAMAYSWHERLTYKQVLSIQSYCKDVLQELNHSLIASPNQLPHPYGIKNPIQVKAPLKFAQQLASMRENNLDEINPNGVPVQLNNFNLPQNLNNTNIEVHKNYKVVEDFNAKVPAKR